MNQHIITEKFNVVG